MLDEFTLQTGRLTLAPLTLGHSGALVTQLCSEPQVVKTLLGDVSTPEGARAQAQLWIDEPGYWKAHGFGSWGVFDRAGQFGPAEALIGVVAATEPPPNVGEGPEIYYFFAPKVWGRGVGREAVTVVADYLIQDLGAPALEALIFAEVNPGSVRLAERLGMTQVGRVPVVGHHLSVERALETVRFDLWRVRQTPAEKGTETLHEAAFRIGQFLGEGVGQREEISAALLAAACAAGLEETMGEASLREAALARLEAGMAAKGMAHYRVPREAYLATRPAGT